MNKPEHFIRIKRIRLRSTWYRPQWRKRRSDPWKDVFIAPFTDPDQAYLWARREYGPDVEIARPRP